MKCVSLYSGADNLGDGIIQAGHEIILCVESNKDCCETIKLNHPDIEVINGTVSDHLESLPRCDAVVGGPPCPEFSRANSDRTFDLCEVNNFRNAQEITKSKYHFMENVQDLYKVHKQRNFLIDAADYGVPQNRLRRIFTDLPPPEATHSEFPSQKLFGGYTKKWVSIRDTLGLAGNLFLSPTGFSKCNQKEISNNIDRPSMTIVIANEYQLTDYPVMSLKYFKNKNPVMYEKHKPNRPDKPCNTITSKDRASGSDMITDGEHIRKLTNEELALLQGFRADFKFYGNKGSIRKQIGNALPAAISKAFFSSIK